MWCGCKKGSTREPFVEIWDKGKKERGFIPSLLQTFFLHKRTTEVYSTVTLSITEGGINGDLSSVLIIQLLLINSIPQLTENHYQRTEYVFIKR